MLALAILFASALFLLLQFPPNHDVAWFLYAAGRVLEGDALYREVVDMNAPAAIWLSMIPAVGDASRPTCSRAAMSRVAWIVDQMPSCQKRRK